MTLIFTETTTTLSKEFVKLFDDGLEVLLSRISNECGVEFSERSSDYIVTGQWDAISVAYKSLSNILTISHSFSHIRKVDIAEKLDNSYTLEENHIDTDQKPRLESNINENTPVDTATKEESSSALSENTGPILLTPTIEPEHLNNNLPKVKNEFQNTNTTLGTGESMENNSLPSVFIDVQCKEESCSSKSTSNVEIKPITSSDCENTCITSTCSESNKLVHTASPPECNTANDVQNEAQLSDSTGKPDVRGSKFESNSGTVADNDTDTDVDKSFSNISGNDSVNENKLESERSISDQRSTTQVLKPKKRGRKKKITNIVADRDASINIGEFKCLECPYVGKKIEHLTCHMEKHKLRYECQICSEEFGLKSVYIRHSLIQHKIKIPQEKRKPKNGTNGFSCAQCSYVTVSEVKLKDHIKRMHVTLFNCEVCKKPFGSRRDRNRHRKYAHSDPRFICPHCQKPFRHKRLLNVHIKTYHEKCDQPVIPSQDRNKAQHVKHILEKSKTSGMNNSKSSECTENIPTEPSEVQDDKSMDECPSSNPKSVKDESINNHSKTPQNKEYRSIWSVFMNSKSEVDSAFESTRNIKINSISTSKYEDTSIAQTPQTCSQSDVQTISNKENVSVNDAENGGKPTNSSEQQDLCCNSGAVDDYDADTDVDENYINITENTESSCSAVEQKETSQVLESEKCGGKEKVKNYVKDHGTDDIEEFKCVECPDVGKKKEHLTCQMEKQKLKYKCEICNEEFRLKHIYRRHCLIEHEIIIQQKKRIPKNGTNEFSCELCSYVTLSEVKLKDHIKRTHITLFNCEVCKKPFGSRRDRNRHRKYAHSDPRFICPHCEKPFRHKKMLNAHIETHEKEHIKTAFPCQKCSKIFSSKPSLDNHIQSEHLGKQKAFLCPTCGKSFTQKGAYRVHAAVHLGIKPYICDQCGKAFTYEKCLREHKYLHDSWNRFQCNFCEKSFKQSTALRIHLKIHTGSKDFVCPTCGKGFTQKQSLKRHERIHSGSRPYRCSICEKTFSSASIIQRHMYLVHKKNPKNWKDGVINTDKPTKDKYFISRPTGTKDNMTENVEENENENTSVGNRDFQTFLWENQPIKYNWKDSEIADKQFQQRNVLDARKRCVSPTLEVERNQQN